ncbi:MAG: isochorismatase family protein [Propionibacteriaceae bacterium]|jgi:nicotinamidase-related amidase|nr:isochorismatase family protein [Propionibacteriaceae bacterium]
MTRPTDRPKTALLVIDCQNGVAADVWQWDVVVAKIVDLVERARHRGVPVVWLQHSSDGLPLGSHEWEIVPDGVPEPADVVAMVNLIWRRHDAPVRTASVVMADAVEWA